MAGLLSSGMAMTVFETDSPGHLDLEALRKGAFSEAIDPDGIKSGWVGLGNLLDTENFILAGNDSRFSAFSFRIDMRRAQPAVVRLQLAEKIQQEEAEGKKLGSKRKKELREEIISRLTEQAEFVPTLTDCLWDVEKGNLMIASTSEKTIDRILKVFEATFKKVPAQLSTDEDMAKVFSEIETKGALRLSNYTVNSLGTASMKAIDANAETSAINVRNNPEAVKEALNRAFQIKKISLMAVDNNNEENQIAFSMDDALILTSLRFPKPEKEDGEDATFLINAQICADTVEMLKEMAHVE